MQEGTWWLEAMIQMVAQDEDVLSLEPALAAGT